jgi:hypothetical protein
MFLECLPSISWWAFLIQNKNEPLFVNHTFQKQCALSQFHISSSNTPFHKLSIPIDGSSKKGLYKDVKISNETNWQKQIWKNIQTAYKSAPFFIYYDYKILPLFEKKYHFLYEFNLDAFEMVKQCIKYSFPQMISKEDRAYQPLLFLDQLKYPQVFDDKNGFIANLSILDLIFNLGPQTIEYLEKISLKYEV